MTSEGDVAWGWLPFADVLLHRAALVARLEPGERDDTADAVDAARGELKQFLDLDSPFSAIVANAALSSGEVEAFAVIAAVELDADRQRVVEQLFGAPWLTPFSLHRLFAGLEVERSPVAPDSGLCRAALLLPIDGPTWAAAALRLAPVVPWWLLGERPRDPDLPDEAEPVDVPALGDADLVVTAGADRVRRLQAVIASLDAPRLLLTPPPAQPRGWDALIRFATLSGSAIVLEVEGDLTPEARRHIDDSTHLPWAVSSPADLPVASLPRRPWTYLQAAAPVASLEELSSVFGPGAEHLPMMLSATQVQQVAELAPRFGADPLTTVRWLAHGRLDQMATRVTPVATWADLILPPDRLTLVQEVMVRQRHKRQVLAEWGMARGAPAATIAMFSGPSGTGKTLAAEVIAGALGLDLYQIDISHLVSKYIGETEKNLGQVFDAAESVPCVLFFDEADALFGKRSDVSDAHDRYANIEVAYLLQRLERHHGIVILASNMPGNVDNAFARRIHVAVDFPKPSADERRRLWDRSLPGPEHRADLDLQQLAERFELTGGNIRNAALRAAFLAAEAGTPLTMDLVTEALRREMAKLGRRFPTGREPNAG